MTQPGTSDDMFADFVEQVVDAAIPNRKTGASYGWEWADLAGPISDEVIRICNLAGQQDPEMPGKLRIDSGTPLKHGGLKPNADAVIVIQFPVFEELGGGEFFAQYNLADELLRYAEDGEGGWDVARQIQRLECTIKKLRSEAELRSWPLPDVPTFTDSTDLVSFTSSR